MTEDGALLYTHTLELDGRVEPERAIGGVLVDPGARARPARASNFSARYLSREDFMNKMIEQGRPAEVTVTRGFYGFTSLGKTQDVLLRSGITILLKHHHTENSKGLLDM